MGQIAIEGMHFYAYHGFYEEEQTIGNEYLVDVYLETNFQGAAYNDDLEQTINYETVYMICKNEMQYKVKLIETICVNIITAIRHQFSQVEDIRVKVTKKNPTLGGRVAHTYVVEDANFVASCGRCGKGHICYKDETCWCQKHAVYPKTQEMLKEQFGKCLCESCLKFYAG